VTGLVGPEIIGPPRIAQRVPGPNSQLLADFASFGVATVHEASWRRGLARGLTPLRSDLRIAGPAVTALCHPGDNLMLNAAIDIALPGDVLVVATLSPSDTGMFGDLLMTLCQAKGIAGLVIDAGVRDTADIRASAFPVWSRVVSASGATKQTAGWVNVPVVCGGVLVHPGDIVCADSDGVVVVNRDEAEQVHAASVARLASEELTRQQYSRGESKDISALLRAVGVHMEAE
jgi:4-hydroxy-4-methyl-2-oxoglutarate aldolase